MTSSPGNSSSNSEYYYDWTFGWGEWSGESEEEGEEEEEGYSQSESSMDSSHMPLFQATTTPTYSLQWASDTFFGNGKTPKTVIAANSTMSGSSNSSSTPFTI